MNMTYQVISERSFDDVVANIEKLTAEKSFRVLHIHDVQATLKEKGFEREPLKIIEICNAKFASEALKKDIMVANFMPCKISVYTENGRTNIMAMRPGAIAEFMPQAGLDELAGNVDKIVTEIVDGAAR